MLIPLYSGPTRCTDPRVGNHPGKTVRPTLLRRDGSPVTQKTAHTNGRRGVDEAKTPQNEPSTPPIRQQAPKDSPPPPRRWGLDCATDAQLPDLLQDLLDAGI